jgi:thiamine-phosphate pyrophosphorylase
MTKIDFKVYLITDRKQASGGCQQDAGGLEESLVGFKKSSGGFARAADSPARICSDSEEAAGGFARASSGAEETAVRLVADVEEALKGGVRAVQLREKDMPVRALLHLAHTLRALTSRYGALLFINDRVDVALSVGADGVHLGRQSIPPEAARRASCGKLLIGVSTHSAKEAYEASDKGADFITLGPVFNTPSKLQYGEPIGLEIISDIRADVKIPIFAIGGIKADSVPAVIQHKADGVAVISGILSAENVFNEAQKFIKAMEPMK